MEEGHDTIQAKQRAIHDDTHIWGKTNPTFGGNPPPIPYSSTQWQIACLCTLVDSVLLPAQPSAGGQEERWRFDSQSGSSPTQPMTVGIVQR